MANGTASHISARRRGDRKNFMAYQKYFAQHMLRVDNFCRSRNFLL